MRAGKALSAKMIAALLELRGGPMLRGGRGPGRIHEITADALRAAGLVIYKRGTAATWNRAYYETKIVITPAGRELLEELDRKAADKHMINRAESVRDRLIAQAKKGT